MLEEREGGRTRPVQTTAFMVFGTDIMYVCMLVFGV